MIGPTLKGLSISNFRSISGSISIPLDAPIVLIHGPNGVGKTSVLSAVELALTGALPSMRRQDTDYMQHLVHQGAEEARIFLAMEDLEAQLVLHGDGLTGEPALGSADARFFSERSYLAQSTLGRLIEIYQTAGAREDSPLLAFVKDLLGLDRMDALVDGLHAAGDRRRVRNLLPDFAGAEAELARVRKNAEMQRARHKSETAALEHIEQQLDEALSKLLGQRSVTKRWPGVEELIAAYSSEADKLLARRVGNDRDAAFLAERWKSVESAPETLALEALQSDAESAHSARVEWQSTIGANIERIIDPLRAVLPDLPIIGATDPSTVVTTAMRQVRDEITRGREILAQESTNLNRVQRLREVLARSRARLTLIDDQLQSISGVAGDLAQTLSGLLPHVHDETCPTCGRDFREISSEPLVAAIAAKAARLTGEADKLVELERARTEVYSTITAAEKELRTLELGLMDDGQKVSVGRRLVFLEETATALGPMTDDVAMGSELMRADERARARLADAANRARNLLEIQRSAEELSRRAGLEASVDASGPRGLVESLVAQTSKARLLASEQLERWRGVAETYRRVKQQVSVVAESASLLADLDAHDSMLAEEINSVEARVGEIRQVARVARSVRQETVSRVFNQDLNAIWRDLFVRLAPMEPFVPTFQVPEAGGLSGPQLSTLHRDGGAGGTPGAMLSSGNLNTAALTLFLALHLAAGRRLPWLVLDDPVQSMDELHVSQLAALLRTIVRQHDRQVIIAVHERPLFDYLALELSPASRGDRLITVELSRGASGQTTAESLYHRWTPDRAFQAV